MKIKAIQIDELEFFSNDLPCDYSKCNFCGKVLKETNEKTIETIINEHDCKE